MNWVQFKDPLSYLCLAGAAVACCSLTQEVAESKFFVTDSVKTIKEKLYCVDFSVLFLQDVLRLVIVFSGI